MVLGNFMRKYCIAFILFFTFGLLLGSMVAAKQTSLSTYYPSSSGAYTNILLKNSNVAGAPNEHYPSCFCAINSGNASGDKAGGCDTGELGVTYSNAGIIFSDPVTGYMEICKSDGSYTSYVGACLNRFCAGPNCASAANACPSNYMAVANSGSPFASSNPLLTATSYSCCFANGAGHYAKTGCFSVYSTDLTTPASCYSVDINSYDVGCQAVGVCGNVRTCCFNAGSQTACGGGPCTLSAVTTCPSSCLCMPGTTQPCGTGTCPAGTETCNATGTGWGSCSNAGTTCFSAVCSSASCNSSGNCPLPTNFSYGASCQPPVSNEICNGSGACICPNNSCGASCCTPLQTECDGGVCCQSTGCPAPSTVACGTAITDNCGVSCGTTGTKCSAPDTCGGGGIPTQCGCTPTNNCAATTCSTTTCWNGCANVPGTECCSTGCAAASTIACGTAYTDNCGTSCGTGTKCSGSLTCVSGSCINVCACPISPGNGCVTDTCCGSYESTFTVAPVIANTFNNPDHPYTYTPGELCPGSCDLTSVVLYQENGQSTCETPGYVCSAIFNGACDPTSGAGSCAAVTTCHEGKYTGGCGQTCDPNCYTGCTGPGGTCCVPNDCSGCSQWDYSDGCNGTCYANCNGDGEECEGDQCCIPYEDYCWTP